MPPDPVATFIARWSDTERAERANKDLFLTELCDLIAVPRPDPAGPDSAENAYVFERAVPLRHPDGRITTGHIDLYKRACFALEAKQEAADSRPGAAVIEPDAQPELSLAPADARASRRADPYGRAMLSAKAQAERYVRHLPDTEPTPLFLIVCDVGHSFEIFADFTQKGRAYLPFPDARSHRLLLTDLRDEKTRARLRAIWLDPASLDPAKASAEVTRQAARHLAELAKTFEADGCEPRHVASFLTRCLFCMFAEDVGLLPKDGFRTLLESLRPTPHGVAYKLETLFRELNTGTPFSTVLNVKLLHFNGGLFSEASALTVSATQLDLLIKAAALQWRDVEPAIFGTLLERALDPAERHKLGAHYTPRAYVERLVLPAVIDPLRAEWSNVLASAISQAEAGRTARAQEDIFKFHRRLCSVRVLDPACGSGNFLYVTLAHFKLLEGEVLEAYERFGGGRRTERGPRGIGAETVDPHQFLGLEINPRAVAIAELVLWIGYLQWHYRTLGQIAPAEPVLKAFKNIREADALLKTSRPPFILTWEMADREHLRYFAPAQIPREVIEREAKARPQAPVTVWDQRSLKIDPQTLKQVPDLSKQVPVYAYEEPREADWPDCDFIVGNPPFIGNKRMRADLGDAYVEALRKTYFEIPQDVDFVMYWWAKAAKLIHAGKIRRFGFITTNSIRQSSNRAILERALYPVRDAEQLTLLFAIPDHPWVDTAEGAAVRIAMTVAGRADLDGLEGELGTVVDEVPNAQRRGELGLKTPPDIEPLLEESPPDREDDGALDVIITRKRGKLHSNLSLGVNLGNCSTLRANGDLSFMGVTLGGDFTLDAQTLASLPAAERRASTIKPLLIGQDLNQLPRGNCVIDFHGLSDSAAAERYPALFARISALVRPTRAQNKRETYREKWWLFAESRGNMRAALDALPRYIATCRTAKHRLFLFVPRGTLCESTIIAIASDDAFHLGVLGSRYHEVFSLAAGSRMGMGNDPRYNNSLCFEPFPFPVTDEDKKQKIRDRAEQIEFHRKRAQADHKLGLTDIYNVLATYRRGKKFTAKERTIYDQALIATLNHLHEELDTAVAAAYDWPTKLSDEQILERLVALNAARAKEEKLGKIRWLRPEFQAPSQDSPSLTAAKKAAKPKPAATAAKRSRVKTPWPKERPAQVEAVSAALNAAGRPMTAADLAAGFARAKKETISEILAALVIIGRAHRGEKRGTFTT